MQPELHSFPKERRRRGIGTMDFIYYCKQIAKEIHSQRLTKDKRSLRTREC
jgi:hypothetical protein